MSPQEKEEFLSQLHSAWERFIDNNKDEGDIMDAEQRMNEVEVELLSKN